MWQNWKLNVWQNSRTQNVTELKNTKCGKTQKFKIWQFKNSKCNKTQKLEIWQNSKGDKTQQLKCDKTQKQKFYNSKTQNMTELKHFNATKLQNLKFNKTQKLKIWQMQQNIKTPKLKRAQMLCSSLNVDGLLTFPKGFCNFFLAN